MEVREVKCIEYSMHPAQPKEEYTEIKYDFNEDEIFIIDKAIKQLDKTSNLYYNYIMNECIETEMLKITLEIVTATTGELQQIILFELDNIDEHYRVCFKKLIKLYLTDEFIEQYPHLYLKVIGE